MKSRTIREIGEKGKARNGGGGKSETARSERKGKRDKRWRDSKERDERKINPGEVIKKQERAGWRRKVNYPKKKQGLKPTMEKIKKQKFKG